MVSYTANTLAGCVHLVYSCGAMFNVLKYRFLNYLQPLIVLFGSYGVYFHLSGPTWKLYLCHIWTVVWLGLSILCNMYIFITHGLLSLQLTFAAEEFTQIIGLNSFLTDLNAATFSTLTHCLLLLSIRDASNRLWSQLEIDDEQLGRPHLSSVKRHSIYAFVWVASVVSTVTILKISYMSTLNTSNRLLFTAGLRSHGSFAVQTNSRHFVLLPDVPSRLPIYCLVYCLLLITLSLAIFLCCTIALLSSA